MANKLNHIDDIPEALEEHINMTSPNESIPVYTGEMKLKSGDTYFSGSGEILMTWQPSISMLFNISLDDVDPIANHVLFDEDSSELILENQEPYPCFITRITSGSNIVEGILIKMPFFGDKSIGVESVYFAIPNLKSFLGDAVIKEINGGLTRSSRRTLLHYKKYEIILEMRPSYRELKEKLSKTGGHLILYNGLLKKVGNTNPIFYGELDNIIKPLNFFLSFVNGRRVSAMLFKGTVDDRTIWSDYDYIATETYISSFSWSTHLMKSTALDPLWNNFMKIWDNGNDKQFLTFAVKWYNEAKMNEVSSDTRLIMAQSTLELIYNWWVIEKNKLICEDDAKDLKAANKIRLLLSQININYNIPTELNELGKLQKKNRFSDGPEAIVYIRNSFVHSSSKKRIDVSSLNPIARAEVVQLANWYIELALLRILNYNGKINLRWGEATLVPWQKTK